MTVMPGLGRRWTESTAEGMALMRALAATDPRFPGGDELAAGFVTHQPVAGLVRLPAAHPLMREMSEHRIPGGYFYEVARSRHMDDIVVEETRQGATQVVLLGAGYDTRAYRLLDQTPGVRFFEVDQSAMSRRKRRKLGRVIDRVPDDVVFVELDFERDDPAAAMRAAGLWTSTRSLWLWSGVSMYLTVNAVNRVLGLVRESSGADSALAFDFMYRAALEGSDEFHGVRESRRYVEEQGEPWHFGLDRDELPSFLSERGFRLESDLGPDDLARRYLTDHAGRAYGKPSGWLGICLARVAPAGATR